MKILLLVPFSLGICGVFSRAWSDAYRYRDEGNEVWIYSSNAIKGATGENKDSTEMFECREGIKIMRFPYKKLGGESFMLWDESWKTRAMELSPDIIIAHCYRHPHTLGALSVANMLKKQGKSCQCWLLGHAPFIEGDVTRSKIASLTVKFYDGIVGPWTLDRFDRIIMISAWERKYWDRLGVDKSKLFYEPNKIAPEFDVRKTPIGKLGKRQVLFLGRVSPIKDLMTLLRAAERLPDVKFSIIGPVEPAYGELLHKHIMDCKMNNVEFYPAIYDIKEKIKAIDSHPIFVLPSIREAMPTVLLEAIARKRKVIASDNPGCRELIEDNGDKVDNGDNEFKGKLFPVGDYVALTHLIKEALE